MYSFVLYRAYLEYIQAHKLAVLYTHNNNGRPILKFFYYKDNCT